MNNKNHTAITAQNLTKVYHRGSEQIFAVNDVSLSIEEGKFVSFVGPSGSGKTTLINILGCLDNPTSGRLEVAGREIFDQGKTLSEAELTRIRRDLFGYIFQKFYLIPTLTVLENVVLPFTFYKKPGASEDMDKVLRLLGIPLTSFLGTRWKSTVITQWMASPVPVCSRPSPPASLGLRTHRDRPGLIFIFYRQFWAGFFCLDIHFFLAYKYQ